MLDVLFVQLQGKDTETFDPLENAYLKTAELGTRQTISFCVQLTKTRSFTVD